MGYVYVLNKNGEPLMPTKRFRKVRLWLKNGEAKIVQKLPFTIQLLFETSNNIQEINLGIDAGSKRIGLSATTKKKVLFEADVTLRTDVVDLISTRSELRRTRRQRKLRYRPKRFKNRHKHKKKGWLAPSVRQKIQTHISSAINVLKILPIFKIIIETASFDIQKIKNPNISGKEYQQGEQYGFWNIRQYVLFRDNYTCQNCFGESGDSVLNVHHKESRKTGGNAPNDLVTLCKTCHKGHHTGKIQLSPELLKRGTKYNDATFMGIMRKTVLEELSKIHLDVEETFGYITKAVRIENNLPKEHYVDARCISGNPLAEPMDFIYIYKKIRRHNRKLYKDKIKKGGKKQRNQCPYMVKGFRRYDLVKLDNKIYYINSLRTNGDFVIKSLNDKSFSMSISPKKLKLYQVRNGFTVNTKKVEVSN